MKRYGITQEQIQNAVSNSNMNVGGEFATPGAVLNVRTVGLFGGGEDPIQKAIVLNDPIAAAKLLRDEDNKRILEIRKVVIATVNNAPISVEDVIAGGRLREGSDLVGLNGVNVGWRPSGGRRTFIRNHFGDESEVVSCDVLLRPSENRQTLREVEARIIELNASKGKLLPGVRIEPYHSPGDGRSGFWVYATLPINTSPKSALEITRKTRTVIGQVSGVDRVVSQVGEPNYRARFRVGLKDGSTEKMIADLNVRLRYELPGIEWLVTTKDPAEIERALPGFPAEHVLKIVGPDLAELERLGDLVQAAMREVPGIEDVGVCRMRSPQMEFRVDLDKCKRWGVSAADVNALLQADLGGKVVTQMVEGVRTCDIVLCWPKHGSSTDLLDLPVDVANNQIAIPPNIGKGLGPPSGTLVETAPRLRLRDLVSPVGKDFVGSGASEIRREQGKRFLPVGYSVNGLPLAEVQHDAMKKIAPLVKAPYQIQMP
jgi:Cu/Ag efflux pump CusA